MRRPNLTALIVAFIISIHTSAWAGSWIRGYGDTPETALNSAFTAANRAIGSRGSGCVGGNQNGINSRLVELDPSTELFAVDVFISHHNGSCRGVRYSREAELDRIQRLGAELSSDIGSVGVPISTTELNNQDINEAIVTDIEYCKNTRGPCEKRHEQRLRTRKYNYIRIPTNGATAKLIGNLGGEFAQLNFKLMRNGGSEPITHFVNADREYVYLPVVSENSGAVPLTLIVTDKANGEPFGAEHHLQVSFAEGTLNQFFYLVSFFGGFLAWVAVIFQGIAAFRISAPK